LANENTLKKHKTPKAMTIATLSSQGEPPWTNIYTMRRDAMRGSPELPHSLLQEPELINLEDYEDVFEEPECVELGDLRSPPLSNETECIEIGQLKASPTTDTMCSKGVSKLLAGLDQSRQEMPSLADAALTQRDERDSFEPVWSWEQHQSAWYGCIVDVAGEAAEFLTEGLIGDGHAIHATEMREDIEAFKEAQLKKQQKDSSKEPTAEQAGAQDEKQQEGQPEVKEEASKEVTSYGEFPILVIEVPEMKEAKMAN
jgi:hypothetical protein